MRDTKDNQNFKLCFYKQKLKDVHKRLKHIYQFLIIAVKTSHCQAIISSFSLQTFFSWFCEWKVFICLFKKFLKLQREIWYYKVVAGCRSIMHKIIYLYSFNPKNLTRNFFYLFFVNTWLAHNFQMYIRCAFIALLLTLVCYFNYTHLNVKLVVKTLLIKQNT